MKTLLYISVLYLCLALLSVGCTKNAPEPNCVQAEVVGQDPCDEGWVILRILDEEMPGGNKSGSFVGQLESGFVTTDNLPEAYQQAGKQLSIAVELNGTYSPRCATVHVMYPAVRVKRICESIE